MISEKTIKSVIRKILVEQASPPGTEWTKIAASRKTKFENDGCTVMKGTDNKWYYKPSTCNSSSSNTSELPAWVANHPCISELILSATSETNKVYEDIGSGAKWYYFEDGTFKQESNGVIKKGKWKCETGDKLRVRLPNSNQQWTEAKGWHAISNYTKCPETLPIKQWCKNDTIKAVQACLKMPIKYQTGNFGPITQKALEDKGQDGKKLTTEIIYNVCSGADEWAKYPCVVNHPGAKKDTSLDEDGNISITYYLNGYAYFSNGRRTNQGSMVNYTCNDPEFTGITGGGTGKVVTGYEDYVKDEIPEE